MPRRIYEKKTKQAILNAVAEARKADKKFPEQYEAAKAAGYLGKPNSLKVLLYNEAKAAKRAKRVTPAGKKRGRPAGSKAKPNAAADGHGLGEITRVIDDAVRAGVNATLDRAIAVLQAARR